MTPEDLERLPDPLERLMSALELNIMLEIVDRIKATKEITPTIDWLIYRARDVGVSARCINSMIEEALSDVDETVNKIYSEALKLDYSRNKEIYAAANKEMKPYDENKWLKQLTDSYKEQTKGSVKNITKTIGFNITRNGKKVFSSTQEYFTDSLDKAITKVTTGAKTYTQAIDDVVDEMTRSGLRTVDYESGRKDRVDVAVRRAVLTGVSQLTSAITEKNMVELDTEYAEVDWHLGARNTGTGFENHQSWQGKVYSKSQLKTICGLGDICGLHGINCRHIIFPFIPGISTRNYTDEWLEEQNKKENEKRTYKCKEFDTYTALQRQRLLERTIRKYKQDVRLLKEAGADKDVITLRQARLKAVEAEYVDFSKAMDLKQRGERLRIARLPKYADLTMSANNDEEVTDEDIRNINKIISFKSYGLNEKLRNSEELTEEERLLVRGVDKAILKLPDYKGVVYRSVGTDIMPDEEKFNRKHQPGEIVTYSAFTSASLEVYDDSMKYLLVITSKRGKDMTEYNPREQEILFKRGSMFLVTGRDGNIIYMEEA